MEKTIDQEHPNLMRVTEQWMRKELRDGCVYIAGYFDERSRLLMHRYRLRHEFGVRVLSRWMDIPLGVSPLPDMPEARIAQAEMDLDDLTKCSLLIIDKTPGDRGKGRYFEMGWCYGTIPIIRIGPATMVFDDIACDMVFDTWEEFYEWLNAAS